MRSSSLEAPREQAPLRERTTGRLTELRPLPPQLSLECEAKGRYEVSFGELDAEALRGAIGERRALLVSTPTAQRLHGARIAEALRGSAVVGSIVLEVREETKSMPFVERVCQEALARGLDRRGVLVSFGGGVVMDVVTLAASLIRRGIGHVRVPTTLIGQIDAGIGLKGAVNFCGKKSFVGCFHAPDRVLVDPSLLSTLPRRLLVAGLGEAVKMAVVRDRVLFGLLEESASRLVESGFADPLPQALEVLRRSVASMLDELRQNPYEDRGYQRIVDFGHTFSPSLESALGFEIQHGEAVAIDMALSTRIARLQGLIAEDDAQRIFALLQTCELPAFSPRLDLPLCRAALDEAARHRGGKANLVVPTGIGTSAFLEAVPDDVLREALA